MAEITDVADEESAYGLLVILNRRGVRLRVEASRVRWRAPNGAMSVELIRQVKTHEAELIELLKPIAYEKRGVD